MDRKNPKERKYNHTGTFQKVPKTGKKHAE
jgi:hypothetical protein